MYDLSTSKETRITTNGSNQYDPAIYGDRIVWTDWRNGDQENWSNCEIYMYNLSTSKETRLTANEFNQYSPAIDGDRIVWEDERNGIGTYGHNKNSDIYMYNLSTSKEIQITSNKSNQMEPTIYGNRIAWIDMRNGGFDVYLLTVPGEETQQILPIADFSSNVSQGYTPLFVQFSDLSQNITARNWDFGDGNTSNEQNPVHIYSVMGTYTVNLTVGNGNGTTSKFSTITVLQVTGASSENNSNNSGSIAESSDGGSSSGGGSSGGSGGGAGGSPEPATNVEVKELSQAFVTNGNSVKFDFPQKVTPVVNVTFDSKKTAGKTTTIVEMLKGKSNLVSGLPADFVYKSLNIWVGNSGFATPNNIENAIVCFKVEKAWIHDKSIDKSSITLNRYTDNKWNLLPTNLSEEDDKYLYFMAKTPGFSPFAITGKNSTKEAITETKAKPDARETEKNNTFATVENIPEQKNNISVPGKENKSTPGFEIICGILGLLGVRLYKRK